MASLSIPADVYSTMRMGMFLQVLRALMLLRFTRSEDERSVSLHLTRILLGSTSVVLHSAYE